MKKLLLFNIVLLFFCCNSDDNESKNNENSNELSITLKYKESNYTTKYQNGFLQNENELPYLVDTLTIVDINKNPNTSLNVNIGDKIIFSNEIIEIIETLNNETKHHKLKLIRDEGLSISPNPNIDAKSSYNLQNSDVYVDAWQLLQGDAFYEKAYADFNNDGHTDVLIASGIFLSQNYMPIYLFYGDGSGVNADFCECGGQCAQFVCNSFSPAPTTIVGNYQGLQHPRKIILGDYNNDQLIDAFIVGHGYDSEPFPGESPVLLLNTGNGFNYQKINEIKGFFHCATSADFDNDGDIDIFLIDSGKEFILLRNNGSANYTVEKDLFVDSHITNLHYYTSESIDVNKDGYIDIIIGGHEHQNAITKIFWGNSSGKYYDQLSTVLPAVDGYKIVIDIDAKDIDNDGDIDFVLNRVNSNNFYEGYYIQIIKNNSQQFTDVTSQIFFNNSGNNWYTWLNIQDLNNDGLLDIYLHADHLNNLKHINNGTSFN